MKNTVFKIGQERLTTRRDADSERGFIFRAITPHKNPSSTRAPTQVMKVASGLMVMSAIPNGVVKFWIKLLRPNANPQIAPPVGPSIIAPMDTGTVKKVMERAGVRKYPSGVNAMTKMIATIKANSTIKWVF